MSLTDGEGQHSGGTRQAMMIAGGASFVLGVAILLWPERDEATLAVVFGVALLISALVQGFLALWARLGFLLRVLVLVSAVLTFVLAGLAFSGGNIELLALWIGLGWTVRGIVLALVAVWDDDRADSWVAELCGLGTLAIGITVIAVTFRTVTGLATMSGAGLIVIGALDLLAAGIVRATRNDTGPASTMSTQAVAER
ncbi:DUF308 domain-containing protein [Nocardia caishijiensis]|uniref:Uncharacterized membrane protein HdeD (DUF308 family) n=1 Tax=Nocardia caishijiensis TaxID=184756 RepID=A0ABQ6YMB2_9NOCA|nr:DUF308 domain-containing protein [Nocardia caishijiensis]KAF0846928.1 uncharacterized membrane protein HdeD (DUF308 family) [Nocardia caishijiensis]